MSLEWQETIARMAKNDPNLKFTSLAHRIDVEALRTAYLSLNSRTAPGSDGITVDDYAVGLDDRLEDLQERLREGRWRASPARRVYIPKPNGKQRPLAIPNVEDRVVQKALTQLLSLIYEQDFLDLSYGFRPGRSPKDALEALRKTIDKQPVSVVFEADIRGFFDNLEHEWLRKFLSHRIADRGVLRLIGKVLKSGVVEEGRVTRSRRGAPQGGPLSPLLANLYLHHVLDQWFIHRHRRTCTGRAWLFRYADDFVVCFEHRADAERFTAAVEERFQAFGLELVPEKTHRIQFGTDEDPGPPGPPSSGGGTFEFLGFTHYLRRHQRRMKSFRRVARKPSKKSRIRFHGECKRWLQRHLHASPWLHHRVLNARLRGFYAYFDLRHCRRSLRHLRRYVLRLWWQALGRRSQKSRMSWAEVLRKPWFRLAHPGQKKRPRKRGKKRPVPPETVLELSRQMELFPFLLDAT